MYDLDGLSYPSTQSTNIRPNDGPEDNIVDMDEDSLLMPPPSRASTRTRRPVQRFNAAPPAKWADEPINNRCKGTNHSPHYCAANSAKHTPRYYNSLKPVN